MTVHDGVRVRAATAADGEALARIYNHYIETTIVTFEEEPVAASEMARRIEEIQSESLPWLLAETDGNVVGYAHASKWKGRCAYRFSVETTVYIDRVHVRQGLGALLYNDLLPVLKSDGMHAAIGGIALPNDASVALHERLGFKKVAQFAEVGFKFGRWVDVGYWEIVFKGETKELRNLGT